MEQFTGYGAFIAMGTNLGDKSENLKQAFAKIEEKGNKVVLKSNIYQTKPYGVKEQRDFYNAVIGILTPYKPQALLNVLKTVEQEMGREETEKWGPRIIDLDIILYGDLILDGERLKIPHPDFKNRDFVLRPLKEIARMIVDPVSEKTMGELYEDLENDSCEKVGTF
ncbi:MAG: 2-amino-4-hydroxy-6-hydroxymethyldihydropteridine diphosphokinase [Thermotogota bacterium]|nr:2-amino-4-hydroxy-6-hydroxymethyldihydropteridine diphosphokinase [Thermotogota bacterium]